MNALAIGAPDLPSESKPPPLIPSYQAISAGTGSKAEPAERDRLGAIWSHVYNTLWYPALPFALLVTGGDAQSRRERLGRTVPHTDCGNSKHRVWLHAASVGEIEGVRPVIRHLASLRRDLEFVTTTMTPAGRAAAGARLNSIAQLAPFDHVMAVRAFVARVRPTLVIVTETELWPNLFLQSAAAGARIALINGRLSARSMSHYRFIRPLLARSLKCASVVLTQTSHDAERFCTLGAVPERIAVTGNTKYEIDSDSPPLRPALAAFVAGRSIFIAGSTGPGEEQVVLAAYRSLAARFPSLALVLAPRHLQRVDEIQQIIRAAGFTHLRASELNSAPAPMLAPTPASVGKATANDPEVLLLDTMGELRGLYRYATVALVGGSLTPGRGGQSLAEPASSSVPVVFGPHYENHRQLGDALITAGAGHVVRDATQLAEACAKWLTDDAARKAAGQRGYAVIAQLAGSTEATVNYLCTLLPD